MWILVCSFVFVAISKAEGSRDMCLHPPGETCNEPDTLYDVPRDAEELMSFCPSWTEFLECLNGYDLACSGRSHYTSLKQPLEFSRLRHIINVYCNVLNPHHKTLVLHLPCIKNRISVDSYICKKTQDEVESAYNHYIITDHERKSSPASERECLRSISYVVCKLEEFKNTCGYSAFKEVDKIVTESQLFPFFCGLETALGLQDILNDMNLDSTLRRSLKKYLTVETDDY